MQTMVLERTVGGTLADRAVDTRLAKSKRRTDSLPEYTRYRDDGCSISASCFDCPLPRCRYEEPGGLRAVLNSVRDEEMTQLRLAGMSVEDLAGYFSVSRRTVFRVIGGLKPDLRLQTRDPRLPIPIRPVIERKEAHIA